MQKRKFDEIVSYFNKKVSEMEIETKYKMELLGMVTALGYEHEKTAQPDIIRCKDCKHFHYDMPYVIQGIPVPVLGHEVCDFWGDGCKTSENGFCSYAERREDG